MGTKGAKITGDATQSAEVLQEELAILGDIRTRKMFGGYGVFEGDRMFAQIDSAGGIFFKANETNLNRFEEAGSEKHARMPYYSVPKTVLADKAALLDWAQASILASKV